MNYHISLWKICVIHDSEKLQLYNVKKYLKNITDKITSYDDYNAPKRYPKIHLWYSLSVPFEDDDFDE